MPDSEFNVKIGSWRFVPRLKLSIFALILFIILVYLGNWQLHRASQKKALATAVETKINSVAVKLSTIAEPSLDKDRFLPVTVAGVYMNQYTFFVDNQIVNRRPGFKVLTPLHSPQLNKWVLIDRGWIPMPPDRQHMPEIEPVFGLQYIRGYINNIATGVALEKDKLQAEPSWPLLIQEFDYNFISEQLQHPIYNFIIQTEKPSSDIFNSDRHIGYALQWFTFAILVLIYYVVMSVKRSED